MAAKRKPRTRKPNVRATARTATRKPPVRKAPARRKPAPTRAAKATIAARGLRLAGVGSEEHDVRSDGGGGTCGRGALLARQNIIRTALFSLDARHRAGSASSHGL